MILVDTSAWIEYIQGRESWVTEKIERHLGRAFLATTEVVVMEVLSGARSAKAASDLRRLIFTCEMVSAADIQSFEAAAALYRRCRQSGVTPRSVNDCLVAATAIRVGASVLHVDSDYEHIARCSDLLLEPLV